MIDFHSHVLPGIDDGSSDAEETAGLLREESRQGAQIVVATPHFYADRVSMDDFLRRREHSIQKMKDHLEKLSAGRDAFQVPDMRYGAEVYFFPGMGRAEKLPELCITGTDLVLIELPFVQWDRLVIRELEDVIRKQKLRIILAHVERYPAFQKDTRVFDEVMEMPLTIQLNGGSFLKSRSKRKFCMNMLKEHENVILGSDTHNLVSRTPNLYEARKVIAAKLGQDRLNRIDKLSEKLLSGT